MKNIIDTLSPETIQTLLSWCETDAYAAVSKRAAKPIAEGGLNLTISASTLCRLYTTHGITESKQARAEYLKALQLDPKASLLSATNEQLELRLLELASRPNPSLAELRLVFQITARLRALALSERRVIVAEKRETRAATPPQPPIPLRPLATPAQIRQRVRVLLGKEEPNELDAQLEQEERELKAYERRQR